MRTIERLAEFKRDYKREFRSGQYQGKLDELLQPVLVALATDQPLAARYRDHVLVGDMADCRECHIKPDLLLIYAKPDDVTLQLVRLGSHSELFG
jgi:mRNA interferase YafQ